MEPPRRHPYQALCLGSWPQVQSSEVFGAAALGIVGGCARGDATALKVRSLGCFPRVQSRRLLLVGVVWMSAVA